MKKVLFLTAAILMFCVVFVSNLYASWAFNLTKTDDTHFGIDFISDEGAIEIWNYNLVIGYTENITISDYDIKIPNSYFSLETPTHDIGDKKISDIQATTFSSLSIETDFRIAVFTIDVSPAAQMDGIYDIFFDYEDPYFGGKFEGNTDENIMSGIDLMSAGHLTYDKMGLDVGTVPIPSTLLLLGGGICALCGLRRKNIN